MRLMIRDTRITFAARPASMGLVFLGWINKRKKTHAGIHLLPRKSPVVKYWGFECSSGICTLGLGPLAVISWG